MKRFLRLFSQFISLLFLLAGCSTLSGFHREEWLTEPQFQLESPLSRAYKTSLYKARINIQDRLFSGLLFFKRLTKGRHRLVFLSEFGLSLLDLEYQGDSFKVMHQQKIFENKAMIPIIAQDLGLLIKKMGKMENVNFYKNETSQTRAIYFEDKGGAYTYFYNANNELIEIKQKIGIFNGIQVLIEGYQKGFPKRILFEHDWTDLRIRLDLIQVKS